MKKTLSIIAIALFLFACSSTKKAAKTNTTANTTTTSSTNSKNDGSSFENAVVITEKSEGAGVSAEYKWLREHYPGYTMIRQSLNYNNKKPYDILKIKTSDGVEKDVYFDISNFFGKF